MVKLQAREIIRAAKRLGITLDRGNDNCAVGVLAKNAGINPWENRDTIAEKLGVNSDDLVALEMGFEAYDTVYKTAIRRNDRESYYWKNEPGVFDRLLKNRYYRVGQNVTKLAGLPAIP